ncbi:FAD-binding protein [Pseudoalteromonas fenneropenaei]|uniref:FAD-binding protein n=1 Tax=Pseudoalteromonas fenneropenaei TaxID=1737459 RepID=A0ABV7CG51_9GAMM
MTDIYHFDETQDPHEQYLQIQALMAQYANNTQRFIAELLQLEIPITRILSPEHAQASETPGLTAYQAQTLIFNTRLRYNPAVIVMCTSTEDVQKVYRTATAYNLLVRVRSGGHDHEGECSGTDAVLIDLSGLKQYDVKKQLSDCGKTEYIAHIGSGYRFYQLVPKLASHQPELTIPHGTCATVGLAGYIQGGGWGPWTRIKGMCCEYLVGATVVLGNGDVITATEHNEHKALLWALRGGGAPSYGIVTEFQVKAFELPNEIHRFEIEWNQPGQTTYREKSVTVLSNWQSTIADTSTAQLVGTNLKINGLPSDQVPTLEAVTRLEHHSIMYGYWQGSESSLTQFVARYLPNGKLTVHGKEDKKNYSMLIGNWDRNSLHQVMQRKPKMLLGTPLLGGQPFKPDYDAPAPHKITSKLVNKNGLCDQGKLQLLQTLTSPLIGKCDEDLGLFCYVTLGAITGPYYQENPNGDSELGVAFPYQDCQYTIQYQTWWNELVTFKQEGQNNLVYQYTNRAMDWIEVCRDTPINNTYGAFISFKDASIPTQTYFQQNYQKLVEIKLEYSKDKYNHLRTRKTII